MKNQVIAPKKSRRSSKAAMASSGTGNRQKPLINKRVAETCSHDKASSYKSELKKLKDEIDILTSYASDTVYRLKYKTMKYDYISHNIIKLLGFTVEEMKSVNFRSLIIETRIITDGIKKIDSFDRLEEVRKKGDVNKWQADYLLRTKDGRRIWVSDVSHPWFDKTGKIIGSIGSLRDITDRVMAESEAKAELSELANTDALTGISNRREFFYQLDRELRRINRTDGNVAMLLIDLDRFQKINDKYGHDIGDRVLQEVSDIIQQSTRDIDLVARLSGGEFGIILTETSSNEAAYVASRIRKTILEHRFSAGGDKSPIGCSISVGVSGATIGDDYESSDLYKIADTRLYIAKNTGRNQVSIDNILHTH